MRKFPLWISFTWSVIFALIIETSLFPGIKLWPFAPFLVLQFYRVTFVRALWLSFFAGLILDLFSSQFPFGVLAFIHTLTTLLLYNQRKHFFEDKVIAFSLYTALVSSFLSLLLILSSPFLGKQVPITIPLLISDLLLMPFSDAIYALLGFTLPSHLYFLVKKTILQKYFTQDENS